ncbi:hypothetical protein AOZ06_41600 [Kibdelosporangium phytohabitans]|uniref:Serine protease n=1 Tax=Kibdelosporangium phytohabitans TaxID=860235 RepID=A0A0N7F4V7_9PSEU|nr:hypothetical protein AOZ06_41600 [Kibdelosporangium phytohabitans]
MAAVGVCVPMAGTTAGAESSKAPMPVPAGARVPADSIGTNKVETIAKANSALGHYYDEAAKQYVVTLPAESKATAAAFQSAGAATRVVHSEFTTQQVTTANSAITQHTWHPAAKKYNYVFYFDPRRDAISLASNAPADVVAPLEKATPGLIYYHYETNVGRDFNRQDDPAPHWGGSLMTPFVNGPICSAGFAVQDGFGNRYMATAGHCFPNGTQLRSGLGTYSFGTFANPTYPLDDLGIIAGSTYQGYVYGGNQISSNARLVYGGGTAVLNTFANYCRSGATTGEQCGNKVVAENGTVCTAGICTGNQYVYRGSGVPSAGGDSGAPLYAVSTDNRGVFVIGIHTGRGGADMLAEPYSSLIAAYGLTAVTSP